MEGSDEKDKLKIKESVMNGIFFGIFTKFLTFFGKRKEKRTFIPTPIKSTKKAPFSKYLPAGCR